MVLALQQTNSGTEPTCCDLLGTNGAAGKSSHKQVVVCMVFRQFYVSSCHEGVEVEQANLRKTAPGKHLIPC